MGRIGLALAAVFAIYCGIQWASQGWAEGPVPAKSPPLKASEDPLADPGGAATPAPSTDELINPNASTGGEEKPGEAKPEAWPFGDPPNAKRLDPKSRVWFDPNRKLVIADGTVCLREGPLEMFACPTGTKEHESVVSVNGRAFLVHAGLLAIGAKPGKPVEFEPEYKHATGPEVEILCLWVDKEGKKHKSRAQEWVRESSNKKAMQFPWIFAGSGFWTDPDSGKEVYLAESGDFICVSNFPSATLDVPIKSSDQAAKGLLFEAFTEHIPAEGTKVRLVLIPKLDAEKPADGKPGEEKPTADKATEGIPAVEGKPELDPK